MAINSSVESFQRWMNKEIQAKQLSMADVPHLIGHLWVQLRQYLTQADAHELFWEIFAEAERKVGSGLLQIELPDGTVWDYRTAEDWEGDEGQREMLIQLSMGLDPDTALRDLIDE